MHKVIWDRAMSTERGFSKCFPGRTYVYQDVVQPDSGEFTTRSV